LRLGGGPRFSINTRGGAILTTNSAAMALKARAPAKTNPITRLRTIFATLLNQAVHVRGRMQTRANREAATRVPAKAALKCMILARGPHDPTIPFMHSGLASNLLQ
jgi:hypothetical protein